MNEKAKKILKLVWIGIQIAAIPVAIVVGYLVSRRPAPKPDSRLDDLRRGATAVGDDLQRAIDDQYAATESTKRIDTLIAEGRSILQGIRNRG